MKTFKILLMMKHKFYFNKEAAYEPCKVSIQRCNFVSYYKNIKGKGFWMNLLQFPHYTLLYNQLTSAWKKIWRKLADIFKMAPD